MFVLLIILNFFRIGILDDFWDAVVLHNLAYVGSFAFSDSLHALFLRSKLFLESDALILLLVGWGIYLILHKRNKKHIFILVWTISAFMGICVQKYFRGHYFIQIIPGLALCAGVAYSWIEENVVSKVKFYKQPFIRIITVLLLLVCPLRINAYYWFKANPKKFVRGIYRYNPIVDGIYLARHIKKNTEPNEHIYVLGSEPTQSLF